MVACVIIILLYTTIERTRMDIGLADFLVIGGGIGGVSCAQELARLKKTENKRIVLISQAAVLSEVGMTVSSSWAHS
jgi:glycine/D-amino acid oxidase-like deaminating enzyme